MTGRRIIEFALRAIGAIGKGEKPSADLFEDALDAFNMLLGSWSVEELMPHHYVPVWTDLYAATPGYTINDGAALDSDGICMNQKPSAGGSQSLTLNGAYASGGVATLDVPRHVIITSTADDSARTFTVVGASTYGDYLSETIVGPNTTTVRGTKQFKTVTGITIDGNSTGRITVGTDYIIDMRRPSKVAWAFYRDSTGVDEQLMVVDRERYEEIADKDAAGVPTRLYYDKSNPSGEAFLHPVPAGGVSIDVNVGAVEHITNGDFALGTSWTPDGQWAIAGDKLVRTPGTGDPILDTELITNGSFTGAATGWSLNGWTYGGNQINIYDNAADRLASQTLTGPDAADECLAVFTIGNNFTYGTTDFPGISQIHSVLGGNSGTSRIIAGTYQDTLVFGNGVFSISGSGAGGLNYLIASVDSVSVKKILGYSEVGADSAKQLAADLATAFIEGHTYRLTFTVSSCTAGTCTPSIGGTDGTAISADGSYSMDIICGTGTDFELAASSDFAGSFDNISVFEVTDDTATAGTAYDLCLDLWLPFVQLSESTTDNEVVYPAEYILAFRWNLAADLAPELGQEVSPMVYARAKETKNIIKMINGIIPKRFAHAPVATVNNQPAVNQN